MHRLGPSLAIALILVACGGNEEQASAPESAPHPEAHVARTSTMAVAKTDSAVPKSLPAMKQEAASMQVADRTVASETAAPQADGVASERGEQQAGKARAPASDAMAAKEEPPMPKTPEAAKTGNAGITASTESISLLLAGDANRGKRLAAKCLACHRLDDRRKVGPGLKGIVGRNAGKMPDMKYSKALAGAQWLWDEPKLAAWICDSKRAVKKFSGDDSATTKMPAQRICEPRDQADLIAFLKSL